MHDFRYKKETISRLAGEGNFSIYKRSKITQRFFIALKLAMNSIAHFLFGKNENIESENIFFIKGKNQLRLHKRANINFQDNDEKSLTFLQPELLGWKKSQEFKYWFKIEKRYLYVQLYFVFAYFILGRKKYLNLYFLSYQSAMEVNIEKYAEKVKNFVCYNDQAYEASSIILALKRLTLAKTIVFQHGLILSPAFYFPVNADEFWAWGELSKKHFTCRSKSTKLLVMGRFSEDQTNKSEIEVDCIEAGMPRILMAPSYNHKEIFDLIKSTLFYTKDLNKNFELVIKLHPATKFIIAIIVYCKLKKIYIESINSDMSDIVVKFDAIVTRNSTSAIEFMLSGKKIFIDCFDLKLDFPSREYTDTISKLANFIEQEKSFKSNNSNRLSFLKLAINV